MGVSVEEMQRAPKEPHPREYSRITESPLETSTHKK